MKKRIYIILSIFIFGCASTSKHFEDGHRAFGKGDYERALKSHHKFLQTNPKDERRIKAEIEIGQAYFNLGKSYYEQEDFEFAEKLFYSANSDEADKWASKCKLKIAENEYLTSKFGDILEKIADITNERCFPEDYIELLVLKMKAIWGQKRLHESIGVYQILCKSENFIKTQEMQTLLDELAYFTLRKGDSLLSAIREEEAIKVYSLLDGISTLYDDEIEVKKESAYLAWARRNAEDGDYEKAAKILEEAKENGISTYKVDQVLSEYRFKEYKIKGDNAYKNREWGQAENYYNQALEFRPITKEIRSKLLTLERKLKLGTVDQFNKRIIVKVSGYKEIEVGWVKEGKHKGRFLRRYKSPEGRASVEVISESDSDNSAVISFSILMASTVPSLYEDVWEIHFFLVDATRLKIPFEDVTSFIAKCIEDNTGRTKKFWNYTISVSTIPSLFMYRITIE